MKFSTRTLLLLFSLHLVLLGGGYLIGDRLGFIAGCVALVLLWLSFLWPRELWLQRHFELIPFEGPDSRSLLRIVQESAQMARTLPPRVMLIKLQEPFAFSTGRTPKTATLYISKGIYDLLDIDEIKAVLTLELVKIQRRQTLLTTLSQTLSGALLGLAKTLDGLLWQKNTHAPQIFQEFLAPAAAAPLKLAIRKEDFYRMDQEASRILGNPKLVARTLWKLHGLSHSQPLDISLSFAPFFTVCPLTKDRYRRYFEIHPPVELRIRRLVGQFPI